MQKLFKLIITLLIFLGIPLIAVQCSDNSKNNPPMEEEYQSGDSITSTDNTLYIPENAYIKFIRH